MAANRRNARAQRGFTLIEMLIVVGIVGLLAAVALPNYSDYIQRSKIVEATSALADMRVRMEQWYLDNRTYIGGCANAKTYALKNVKHFTISCPTETATTYKIKADGIKAEGMDKFSYSLTVDPGVGVGDIKATEGVPTGWSKASDCWTTRKDGTCG